MTRVAMSKPAFEDGHFYSPVVNQGELSKDKDRIWRRLPDMLAVDVNPSMHEELLKVRFPPLLSEFSYPDTGAADSELHHFYESNGQFENLDPRALFCFMRLFRPRRIIEVGSGYSTLLMMDVNARFLDNKTSITSIERYPRPFLQRENDDGRIRLLRHRVQEIDLRIFDQLEDGDILFIDSSHVSKTGSDVNYMFLEVLPRIRPGVYVHVHDIFLPEEYPQDWVIEGGRSWNEQYLLRAFLQFNTEFRVVFGAWFASRQFPEDVRKLTDDRRPVGGSFWMRRKPKNSLFSATKRALAYAKRQGYWRP
jgi:predicted O-methyltransferase YrrM